jgi:hypothetical protein
MSCHQVIGEPFGLKSGGCPLGPSNRVISHPVHAQGAAVMIIVPQTPGATGKERRQTLSVLAACARDAGIDPLLELAGLADQDNQSFQGGGLHSA